MFLSLSLPLPPPPLTLSLKSIKKKKNTYPWVGIKKIIKTVWGEGWLWGGRGGRE